MRRQRSSSRGRRSSAGKTTLTIAGVTDLASESDHRHGGEHREVLRAADHRGIVGGLGAGEGGTLTITARAMGTAGNAIALTASTGSAIFTATSESTTLVGGADGEWLTDLERHAAVQSRGSRLDAELHRGAEGVRDRRCGGVQHGVAARRRRPEAGSRNDIPIGAVPSATRRRCRPNFGPAEHRILEAGLPRYGGRDGRKRARVRICNSVKCSGGTLPNVAGMPFYDDYTRARFPSTYGTPMRTITSEHADPALFPQECELLPRLIGEFTNAVMAHVRQGTRTAASKCCIRPTRTTRRYAGRINYPV